MAKAFKPQIVSANDLMSGDVVYLDARGAWTRDLTQARIADDPDTASQMLEAALSRPHETAGAYLFAVTRSSDGAPVPAHIREILRARGPSIRPDLGRQAQVVPAVAA